MMRLRRRDFIAVAGAGLASACSRPALKPKAGTAAVAVIKASSYQEDLTAKVEEGLRACRLDVRGKRVLLKPNFVEYDRSRPINTDPHVVLAALEVFTKLGAAGVVIGEGPGHRRDTFAMAEEAGYRETIERFDERFVDLNLDDVSPAPATFGDPTIYLPNTALAADLIVSLAKMKTHHWAGATLSMKNLFGLVPGCVYGWPKNKLHYAGIPESVVGLNRIFRRTFAIVDGIVGMEGNGPIQGTPKAGGVLVMGADLVAVDATCCRIMGIDPAKVDYLTGAVDLGILDEKRIEQRGEAPSSCRTSFHLIPEFSHLRLA